MHRNLRSLLWLLGSASVVACSSAGSATGGTDASDPTQGASPNNADPSAPGSGAPGSAASSGGTSGTSGTSGDAGAPPPPPCGTAAGTKCDLGRTCAANADCASSLCQTEGVAKGTCASAKSCAGGEGANLKCNAGTEDCCNSIPVPGGSFSNADPYVTSAATVAAFKLDKFEITVGRMRAFYTAVGGDPRGHAPAPGAGAHPLIPGSGWRTSWNVRLPGSWAEIDARMRTACAVGGNVSQWGAATWTPAPGANEEKPVNCLDWYTLFAFAIWDGGRLPTDAEWSYVAYSGAEQRAFPWGNDVATYQTHKDILTTSFLVPNQTYGVYTEGTTYRAIDDGPLHLSHVGIKTGRSKWGHADMGGNVIEFVLDVARSLPTTCSNCANVAFPDPPQGTPVQPLYWQPLDANGNPPPGDGPDDFNDAKAVQDGKRFARGGSWMGEYEGHPLANNRNRFWAPLWRTYGAIGARVARDL
jgi:sulfatase modifying factor 1